MTKEKGYTTGLQDKTLILPETEFGYSNDDVRMGELRQRIYKLEKALREIANPRDVVYGYANELVDIAKEALK